MISFGILLAANAFANALDPRQRTPQTSTLRNFGTPYWSDPRIHTMGNNNLIHALVAPLFTKFLDLCVYENRDVRLEALQALQRTFPSEKFHTIADFGCGTGISTDAARKAFPTARVVGYDTSKEMVAVGKILHPQLQLLVGNAHEELHLNTFDLVVFSFLFHEIPTAEAIELLHLAKRCSKKVVILDIAPDYSASRMMLLGEPYILDYQRNFVHDCRAVFGDVTATVLVPGHLELIMASSPPSPPSPSL